MLGSESPVLGPSIANRSDAAFRTSLDCLIGSHALLWNRASESEGVPGRRFSPRQQRRNERETDRLGDFLEMEFRRFPESEADRVSWRTRILRELRGFGKSCLRYPEEYFRLLFSNDYFALTRDFVRRVREFDDGLVVEDLFQALRNVWIMGILQAFLDRRISISASIFAYSMLYPYSDNFLDDPGVPGIRKAELNWRFSRRLAGEMLPPRESLERSLFSLVAMIESQYPRADFPQVYSSLLAIQRAQEKSLLQQDPEVALGPDDILAISLEKGGASVLADGYLVAGDLGPEEAEFFFGYGVLLQLLDDLQDVSTDLERRHRTLFSTQDGPLDASASRLCGFMDLFLNSSKRFSAPRFDILKDLIRRNCAFLFLHAVAFNQQHYTEAYLRGLEPRSPVSFAYMRERRTEIESKYRRFREEPGNRIDLDSILDLLG